MEPLEYLRLAAEVIVLLGMLAGLAKFFFSMQKAIDLLKLETKGHVAGLKKDIKRLEENGLTTIKENQSRCINKREEIESKLFDLTRSVSDEVIAIKAKLEN